MPATPSRQPDNAEPPPAAAPVASSFPTWPLLATLATQSLATMAAYSFPAAAPAIARDLQVPGTLVGFFISTVYGVGILSALLSPRFIHRYGAVRVSQIVLLATLAMLLACAMGSLLSVAIGAALLGLAYGGVAPASTHLLVPRTPHSVMNLVLSLRQIGVPLGRRAGRTGDGAAHRAPGAGAPRLLCQAVPVLILLLVIQITARALGQMTAIPSTPSSARAYWHPRKCCAKARRYAASHWRASSTPGCSCASSPS